MSTAMRPPSLWRRALCVLAGGHAYRMGMTGAMCERCLWFAAWRPRRR